MAFPPPPPNVCGWLSHSRPPPPTPRGGASTLPWHPTHVPNRTHQFAWGRSFLLPALLWCRGPASVVGWCLALVCALVRGWFLGLVSGRCNASCWPGLGSRSLPHLTVGCWSLVCFHRRGIGVVGRALRLPDAAASRGSLSCVAGRRGWVGRLVLVGCGVVVGGVVVVVPVVVSVVEGMGWSASAAGSVRRFFHLAGGLREGSS
jgi:hypothetical protein